jgi:hypothetical protein
MAALSIPAMDGKFRELHSLAMIHVPTNQTPTRRLFSFPLNLKNLKQQTKIIPNL